MGVELKACPMCQAALLERYQGTGLHGFFHPDGDCFLARVVIDATDAAQIKAWNRRSPTPDGLVEALRRCIGALEHSDAEHYAIPISNAHAALSKAGVAL